MISVDNVNCRGRLTDVTLEFPAGAKVGIMGRSGAGKSSLISVLTGQLLPDSGTVAMPSGGIGYIPQDPGTTLLPNRPAVDSICEFARDRVGDVPEVLASLGLDPQLAERRPSELSGGQRQRIAVARALIGNPDLFIADEAFSALDSDTSALLERVLLGTEATVLLISHDIGRLLRTCTHMVVLADGRVVFSGDLDGLGTCEKPEVVELLAAAKELAE